MLAINPTGPKEIVVYVVVAIIILAGIIWFVARGRART
jgi:hypothetical protein